MLALLPQLKTIARSAEKNSPKFMQMVDSSLRIVKATEKDPDVRRCIPEVLAIIDKLNMISHKVCTLL